MRRGGVLRRGGVFCFMLRGFRRSVGWELFPIEVEKRPSLGIFSCWIFGGVNGSVCLGFQLFEVTMVGWAW